MSVSKKRVHRLYRSNASISVGLAAGGLVAWLWRRRHRAPAVGIEHPPPEKEHAS